MLVPISCFPLQPPPYSSATGTRPQFGMSLFIKRMPSPDVCVYQLCVYGEPRCPPHIVTLYPDGPASSAYASSSCSRISIELTGSMSEHLAMLMCLACQAWHCQCRRKCWSRACFVQKATDSVDLMQRIVSSTSVAFGLQAVTMFIRVPLVFSTLLLAQITVSVLAAPAPPESGVLEKRAISQTLFDDLVRYTKYSSAAGQDSCPRPLGNTRVLQASSLGRVRTFTDKACSSRTKPLIRKDSSLVMTLARR